MKTAKTIAISVCTGRAARLSMMGLALIGLSLGLAGCADLSTGSTRSPGSPFEAVSAPNNGPPMLRLENESSIEANVDCTGQSSQSIIVPPGEQREVRLPAGTYVCMLSGGNATPTTWTETYREDTLYSMKLWTTDHYVSAEYSTERYVPAAY